MCNQFNKVMESFLITNKLKSDFQIINDVIYIKSIKVVSATANRTVSIN